MFEACNVCVMAECLVSFEKPKVAVGSEVVVKVVKNCSYN